MLFVSILMSIWFVVWLFFNYEKHEMLQTITGVVLSLVEEDEQESEDDTN